MLRWLTLLLLLLPVCVQAGAWPRGKGNVFVTTSAYLTYSGGGVPAGFGAIYLEWGATDKLTFGLDMGRGVSGKSKIVAFARYPIGKQDKKNRFALELGVGQLASGKVLRPGISFGRGFQSKLGGGWISIDTVAEIGLESGFTDLKTDITIGLQPRPKLKTMVQFQAGLRENDPAFLRIVPSIVWEMKEKRHMELGVTHGLIGPKETGLKFSIWREF